jgi:hypothetical protein
MPADNCQYDGCTRRISKERLKYGGKYCSSQHQTGAAQRRVAARKKAEKEAELVMMGVTDAPTARRGDAYRSMIDPENEHLVTLLLRGELDANYLANVLGFTKSAILRAAQAVRTTRKMEELKIDWIPSWRVRAMLPTWKLERLKALGAKGEGSDEFERLADELTNAYAVFSRYYFTLEGERPIVADFHLEWIRSIIVAYAVGGKQLILSPPRHGKSEMLVRFAVWLIAMFPNIRIMWVAANTDVAKLMLGAVKDHLTNNEKLIRDVLPPGEVFKPSRDAARPWSGKEIKVAQQSHVGQKSSSMLALGRTSKILSRDVDLLIVDDLEDFDSTRESGQREYSRNKFAEIGTRKEERTGWVNICSRQHPDDIPSKLMTLDGTLLAWRTIVNSAHDETCGLDPDDIAGHDEAGCVLFPAVRSYSWLTEKKLEMEALGLPGAYEMRYLNRPIPETGIVFDIPLIKEMALDHSRGLGTEGLPGGRLVAGLDPSARGVQASFLWHYANKTLSMVDLETQEAGGIDGAIEIILRWYKRYGVNTWYFETNSQQTEFYKMVKRGVHAVYPMILIKEHDTNKNKQSAELGISAMAPLYHGGNVNLPFGTTEARVKVNLLLRQLELWTTDGVKNKRAKTDIKMSQWFPFVGAIERWMRDDADITLTISEGSSYPGYGSISSAPWGHTGYPGS